jgi:hypothetical protein
MTKRERGLGIKERAAFLAAEESREPVQQDYATPEEFLASDEGQQAVSNARERHDQRKAFADLRVYEDHLGLEY